MAEKEAEKAPAQVRVVCAGSIFVLPHRDVCSHRTISVAPILIFLVFKYAAGDSGDYGGKGSGKGTSTGKNGLYCFRTNLAPILIASL